jgi:hypothetical protein
MTKNIKNHRILSATLFALAFLASTPKLRAQEQSSDFSKHLTSVHLGIDVTEWTGTNVDSGFGFSGGATQYFYFHKFVGAFVGLDYSARSMGISSSSKTHWLDIPFGPSFRFSNSAIEGMKSTLDLGLVYMLPLTKTPADTAIGDLNGVLGLHFGASTFFEISPSFEFGFYVTMKLGFKTAFEASGLDVGNPYPISLGLTGRFTL